MICILNNLLFCYPFTRSGRHSVIAEIDFGGRKVIFRTFNCIFRFQFLGALEVDPVNAREIIVIENWEAQQALNELAEENNRRKQLGASHHSELLD